MEPPEIADFLEHFEKVRGRTRRVIDCIPPEKCDWRCAPGKFSFADLVRHLGATERYMWGENAQGRPSRYPGHGPELAREFPAVLAFFDRMHAESMEIFRRLTPAQWNSKCQTPGGTSITVWKWLRAMIEHEIHHRGQIYLMLGMIGVPTPPLYGLTSEQVYAGSEHGPGGAD